jgi:hypothetical protein
MAGGGRAVRGSVGRRGLLAGVAALVGGLLARSSVRPTLASDGEIVRIGQANDAESTTELKVDPGVLGQALRVVSMPVPFPPDGDRPVAVLAQGGDEGSHAVSAGTGLATGGGDDPVGPTPGGFGIVPSGGNSVGGPAGTALIVRGGDSLHGSGGEGAKVVGGLSSHGVGGVGLRTMGGASIDQPGGQSGVGIQALGGNTFSGLAGDGIVGRGGEGGARGRQGGIGVIGYGGTRRRGGGKGAAGVVGIGGGPAGLGQTGVVGIGGADNPGLRGSSEGDAAGLAGQCSSDTTSIDHLVAAVHGISVDGTGGSFESTDGQGLAGTGINAAIMAFSTSEAALYGTSESAEGISAVSSDKPACEGRSMSNSGGYFETKSAAAIGLHAQNVPASLGQGGNGMFVSGSLKVANGIVVTNGVKSVAVPTSRGMTLLYCREATVSLFEDFGTARLIGGRARVELDPLFAETIETGSYHVFLTARAEHGGVYLGARDARGFELRERRPTGGPVEVDYHVVGQRKGLPPGHRLATFSPPVRPKLPDPRWLQRPPDPRLPKLRVPPPPPPPRPDAPAPLREPDEVAP